MSVLGFGLPIICLILDQMSLVEFRCDILLHVLIQAFCCCCCCFNGFNVFIIYGFVFVSEIFTGCVASMGS